MIARVQIFLLLALLTREINRWQQTAQRGSRGPQRSLRSLGWGIAKLKRSVSNERRPLVEKQGERGESIWPSRSLPFVICLSLGLMTSCFNAVDMPIVQRYTESWQKHKVNSLQKKLEVAEEEQKKIEEEVEQLTAELNAVQLSVIRKQIDAAEKKKTPSLFLEERETLYQIIQNGPSSSALEAQAELDRILRMITESSDEKKSA